ncbi:MAG TPA: DMT family transporter [Sulfolobales archaeon]|nr:DMT family transporter [Sulfolobales archaeon]
MVHRWGYIAAISSALLFGLGATLNKIVLADVHPTVVAGAIYMFAGLFLSIVRFSPLSSRLLTILAIPTGAEARIDKKDLGILALIILSGSTVAPLLYLNGLNQTTAVNASLLQNTESLFTALIAFLFLGERAYEKDWVGIFLIFVGALFLTTNGEFHLLTLTQNLLGNLLIVMASMFWGIDNNLSKLLSRKDIVIVTAIKCLAGGAVLLLLSKLLGLPLQIPLSALPYMLSAGALSIGFSILLFLLGLREIGAMKTGIIFSTSSLFGAVFAFIILREGFSLIQLLAGLTMLLGVYIMYRE